MNDAHSESRLDALEMRIAYQDQTIAEINDLLTSQWRTLEALQREVRELREEVRNMTPSRTNPEPAPPHY